MRIAIDRERMVDALFAPFDPASLVVFRAVLGTLVSVSAVRFLAYGWVDELFVKPTFFFKYWGFGWVSVLPAPWMHVVFVALAVLGLAFASGLFFRVVAPLTFLLFTYVQLIDVTNWLNHYYLVSLLLLLSAFMPLGRAWSLDAAIAPSQRRDTFPAWCTYLLRFQVAIVYVNAGLAKLTSDWLLHAQPLDIWLSSRSDFPLLAALGGARWVPYAFSWGGFLFDTTVVFFLLWGRTRAPAYVVLLAFHAVVGALFPIGMFPFIMAGAALVFFSPSWPRRIFGASARTSPTVGDSAPSPRPRRGFFALVATYCAIQLLVPLRAHLYGGNVLWHEQGMRLSWRVMVREKNGSVTYLVHSNAAGRTWYVEPRTYLTDRQARELQSQPDLVLQLARHVARDFRARGHADVEVRADAIVSLNGRASAPMIDSTVDLAKVGPSLRNATWILPAPSGPPIHLRSPWKSSRLAAR